MTPDEQAYASVRYTYRPLLIITLPSGSVAIGSGYNPFPLEALFATFGEAAGYVLHNSMVQRAAPPPPEQLTFDFLLQLEI